MSALSAVQAEALAGTDDIEVVFDVVGEDDEVTSYVFSVAPVRRWKSSAHSALRQGDFETWASKVLTEGTYSSAWQALDPDLDQINAIFKAWEQAAGEDAPKRRPASPSSRTTRKR